MAELVVVYKTSAKNVSQIVGHLQRRNLSPVALDDVESFTHYHGPDSEVRIAVPETQRDMALSILAEMERQEHARAAPHIKAADGAIMLVIIAGVFLAVINVLDSSGKCLPILGMALAAVIGVVLIRRAWGKGPDSK